MATQVRCLRRINGVVLGGEAGMEKDKPKSPARTRAKLLWPQPAEPVL